MKHIGLLVMAYGGPDNIDEVEPYLLDVRGYRPTAPEVIHEVRERYREIGGRLALLGRNQAQALGRQAGFDPGGPGPEALVGRRHRAPEINEPLARVETAVTVQDIR